MSDSTHGAVGHIRLCELGNRILTAHIIKYVILMFLIQDELMTLRSALHVRIVAEDNDNGNFNIGCSLLLTTTTTMPAPTTTTTTQETT